MVEAPAFLGAEQMHSYALAGDCSHPHRNPTQNQNHPDMHRMSWPRMLMMESVLLGD